MIKDSNLERCSILSERQDMNWQVHSEPKLNITISGLFHIFKEKNSHYKLMEFSYSKPYLVKQSKKNVLKVVDVSKALLIHTKNEIVGEGILLKLNNSSIQLYGQIIKLFEALKEICIQINFHEKYFLYRQISGSHSSKVFLAENKLSKTDYVVKVFEKNSFTSIENEHGLKALKLEIQVLEEIKNSTANFVQLLEIFEGQQAIYLVFDQCKGGDLQRYIQENANIITEKMAFNAVRQLLESICFLHDLNYMHRDLKPENILLEQKDSLDTLIISDFGLAQKIENQENYLFVQCGTPGYMAPEVIKNQQYDQKVDVYGIGIILFMLLTGRNPYSAIIKDEVINSNLKGVIDFDKVRCSDLGKDLLKKLLQIQPCQRPTARQALRHRYFFSQNICFQLTEKEKFVKKKLIEEPQSEKMSPVTPLLQQDFVQSPQIQSQFIRKRSTNLSTLISQNSYLYKKTQREFQ